MQVRLIEDIKEVKAFKAGWDLVEYEAGTDPLDGCTVLGFDEIGQFCQKPQYAWVRWGGYK
jgi:hypothetical protein